MVAVITGASGGLGRELAGQLAAKGWDLLLTARRAGQLEALAAAQRAAHGVAVQVGPADLSRPEEVGALLRAGADLPVGLVINNAGAGQIGASSDIPWEAEEALLTANMLAPCRLTKAFAASMERGCILNVASLAGFQPEPGMASYAASKAFLLQWSRAVGYELKREGRPVRLAVLCPGPLATGFDRAAGATAVRRGMSPTRCARIALRGLARGKTVILPGAGAKLLHLLGKLLPTRLMLPAQYRIQGRKIQR